MFGLTVFAPVSWPWNGRADRNSEFWTHSSLAEVLRLQGRVQESIELARSALEIAQRTGERSMQAWTYLHLGQALLVQGELVEAQNLLDQSLAICDEVGYQHLSGYVLKELGVVAWARRDLDSARKLLEDSSKIRTDLREKGLLAETQLAQAEFSLEVGELAASRKLATLAAEEFTRESRRDHAALAASVLARAHLEAGNVEAAEEILADAVVHAKSSENPAVVLTLALVEGRLHALNDPQKARSRFEEAEREARRLDLAHIELEATLALGELEFAEGDPGAARARLQTLAADASRRGFTLIADKARAVR